VFDVFFQLTRYNYISYLHTYLFIYRLVSHCGYTAWAETEL